MPDITYNQFPISGKIVDFDTLQSDVANLNANAVLESRTINGYDLSENRTIYAQDVPSRNVLSPDIVQGSLSSSGAETSATTRCRSGYAPVSASTAYTVSVTSPLVYEIHEYTSAKAWIKYTSISATSGEITTSATTAYLRILFRKSDNADVIPSEITDPMIRPSTAPAGYVPYAKTNVELSQAILGEEWTTLYNTGSSTQCTLVSFTATPTFTWFSVYANKARTKYRLLCRVKFDNVVRQSGGVAFKIATTHHPPKDKYGYGGLRSTGGNTGQSAYWGVDTAYWMYSTDGVITVYITETYTNIANGNSLYVLIPATESVP